MWGQLPQLSATPEVWGCCIRGCILNCLAADGAEVRSCLVWHLLLLFTLFWCHGSCLPRHKLSPNANTTGEVEGHLPEGLKPTNTRLLLCQHIRGDLVPLLSVFGLWLSCQLSWTLSGRYLAQQILHLLMAFEKPCFWGFRSCIITTAS